MTTFTKLVAVAVATVSLMAAAPAFACSGTLTQAEVEGLRNEIDLSLSGRDLYASFVQAGYDNEAIVGIRGACNAAVVLQDGRFNNLYAKLIDTDFGLAMSGDWNDVDVDSNGCVIGGAVYGNNNRVRIRCRG